jgi:hypothetical protein
MDRLCGISRERVDSPGRLETPGSLPGLHEIILVLRSPFYDETCSASGKVTGN